MKVLYTFSIIVFIIFLDSCNQKKTNERIVQNDFNCTQIWADTIIYEVLINNPDTINKWENRKVKSVRKKKIVDDLFSMVYNGTKIPYHYYTKKPLSIEDIKELESEEEFSRDKVGKLQFTECWKYDSINNRMQKVVLNILLTYEKYGSSGNLRGYKAAFYLKDF